MMRSVFQSICFLFLSCFSFSSFSDYYEYNSERPFYLGAGLQTLHLEETFQPCITYDKSASISSQGADGSGIKTAVVKTHRELFSTIGFSSHVSAQFLTAKANGGLSFLADMQFSQDDLVWVIGGYVDHGWVRMNNPQLTDQAKKLIENHQYDTFAKRCGTHYVDMERQGGFLLAMFRIHQVDHEEKTKFESFLQGSGSLGIVSGEVKQGFKVALGHAFQLSQFEYHVIVKGGKGLPALSGMVQTEADLQKFQETLAHYIETMTRETAAPTGYQIGSMGTFGHELPGPFEVKWRDEMLSEYFFSISEIKDIRKQLKIIVKNGQEVYPHLTKSERAYYQELYQESSNILNQLKKESSDCLREIGNCRYPDSYSNLKEVNWPKPTSLCEFSRLRAYESGVIDEEELNRMRVAKMGVILWLDHSEIIASLPCEEMKRQ